MADIPDEWVEWAAKAHARWWSISDRNLEYLARMRAALEAVLPEAIRQAKAEALREAADDLERRINDIDLIRASIRYEGWFAGNRSRGQQEAVRLRDCADRIERGGE